MEILDRIKVFKLAKKEIKRAVKDYVQDKTIPLEKRWEVFITSELGNHEGIYHNPDGINWNKNTLCDDFYMSRYEIITAVSFVEVAQDNSEEKGYDINAVKEYFLNEFLWSFENDW